jgi:uncharacterized protein with FMN-binding domain
MRRAAFAVALTIAGLIFVLSYRTPLASMMAAASSNPPVTERTGAVTETADGPVQVQVTLSGGKITRISVPVQPDPPRRPRVRARDRTALARLILETLTAQGTQIHKVAGSGSLSAGYIASLRSALRQAQGGRASAGRASAGRASAGRASAGRASAGRAGHGHHHGRQKAARQHGGGADQPGGQ